MSVPEDAAGCDRLVIHPKPVAGLTWAKGEYRSAKGPVKVAWKISDGKMKLSVEVPAGVAAKVWLADKGKMIEVGAGRHEW